MAESSWNPASERYEPGFQTRYLEGKGFETSQYWISRSDPGALTIREWFSQNPGREDEMGSLNDYELNLIAQTRMSSSYGLMQTMYLTAYQSCGYRGEPEGLNDPGESIDCGTRYLKSRMDMYGSLADAVSAYNAGSALWRTNGPNKQYTEKVLGLYNAFRACPE